MVGMVVLWGNMHLQKQTSCSIYTQIAKASATLAEGTSRTGANRKGMGPCGKACFRRELRKPQEVSPYPFQQRIHLLTLSGEGTLVDGCMFFQGG